MSVPSPLNPLSHPPTPKNEARDNAPGRLHHQRVERLRERPPRVHLDPQPLPELREALPPRGDLGDEVDPRGGELRAGRLVQLGGGDGAEDVGGEVADRSPGPVPV